MKRLIFSDTHLHPFSYGATITKSGFNSRLFSQFQAAMAMIDDARNLKIEYAYFCGDLFHKHGYIPTQALVVASAIFKRFRDYGIKVRAIPGNHDQYNQLGTIHALSFLNEEEYSCYWEDGILIKALPYTNDDEMIKEFLRDAGEDCTRMVLMHQGVSGVPLSSGYMIDERLNPNMIPESVHVFTGHYHFFKEVTPNLTVIGNLTPLNYSDIDQKKGWLIWDDETNEIERRYQTQSPNFISWDEKKEEALIKGNFVRYTTPINPKDQSDIRKSLLEKGALAVEFPVMKIKKQQQDKIEASEGSLINSLIKNIDEQNTGRRKVIGVETREEKYNFPGEKNVIRNN